MFIYMGINRGTNSLNHRAGIVSLSLLSVITLSGCAALHSQQATPTSHLSLTSARKSGVLIVGRDTLGYRVEQVHTPDSNRFVNNAVLYSHKSQIRQFNRSNQPIPSALDAAIRIYNAKVGSSVAFANGRFRVSATSRKTGTDGWTELRTKLASTDTPSKVFEADFRFRFRRGLLVKVELPKAIEPSKDAADICYYYPAECLTEFAVSYDTKRVDSTMAAAQAKYERKWLRQPGSSKTFESLMATAARTYRDLTSWTTVSADGSQGSIYDSTKNLGVTWGPYDPTRAFGAPSYRFQSDSPDLGWISDTFFDTTDGGSNFFYSAVRFLNSAQSYVVTNFDGTTAVEFHVKDGRISGITNFFLGNETISLSSGANTELLKSKLAYAPSGSAKN
jgi:hypothetical protein